MKNFFKKLFGDKYPERAAKKNRIEAVYAGPEQMKRKFGRMEKVYAGPPAHDRDRDNAMEDVYAGPDPDIDPDETPAGPDGECEESDSGAAKDLKRDQLKGLGRRQFSAVYAAPPNIPPAQMMMAYAGPAQMRPETQMMAVYAGPAQMQNNPMMLVYAGPGGFVRPEPPVDNGQDEKKFIGGDEMRGKTPEQIVREGHCHICGGPVNEGQRFCSNCGTPLPRNTTPPVERA